jgi:hypothetical protein
VDITADVGVVTGVGVTTGVDVTTGVGITTDGIGIDSFSDCTGVDVTNVGVTADVDVMTGVGAIAGVSVITGVGIISGFASNTHPSLLYVVSPSFMASCHTLFH